jgi:murein DD-endopeptidase MepM/ murein hydrolase activator NlpD
VKQNKYTYNASNGNFEKWKAPLSTIVLRAIGFLCATLVTIALTVWVVYRYVPSPGEQQMKRQQAYLQEQIDILKTEIATQHQSLNQLQKKDNAVYRTIFEADPLPQNSTQYSEAALAKKLSPYNNTELIEQMQINIDAIATRIKAQDKSYAELQTLITNKQEMLASIPSIQPVSNATLERIASGFGVRIDPIYKVPRLHTGLDFTAPQGTPIYATGNGKVSEVNYNASGYGNYVRINHGYNFETLYGHMIKANVRQGQDVKRGQVIGWVGSTGKSTGPHCHYEVIRNDDKIDPIHFFYNDIKPQEYEQMVRIASAGNQSLD